MKKHSDSTHYEEELRKKVLGMGTKSVRKSYYPTLRKKMSELERYMALLDQAKNAICLLEVPLLKVVNANKSARTLLVLDQYPDSSLLDMIEVPAATAITDWLEAAGEGNHYFQLESALYSYVQETYSSAIYELTLTTVEFKKTRYLVCVAQDISERKKLDQMKDEMISAVSHEMSTPLTAMLGFCEFMLENEVPAEQQQEFLQIIFKESQRLKGLIDNLLSLQRMRAGMGCVNFTWINLSMLFGELCQLFDKYSATHTIKVDCPTDFPLVSADQLCLQQAMENLISNAIKYSPKGGTVTLTARQNENGVVVSVKDEGVGISPVVQEQIFDRFFRIDTKNGQKVGGTGLGLPLVKEIISLHNGEVWVESEEGQGSTFCFSLPLERG